MKKIIFGLLFAEFIFVAATVGAIQRAALRKIDVALTNLPNANRSIRAQIRRMLLEDRVFFGAREWHHAISRR